MRDNRNRSAEFRNSAAKKLQMPPNVFGGTAQIELIGNREATIEGCIGIIEYGENEIALNLGDVTATFTGIRLKMKCMTKTSAVIEGKIMNIQFK